jgi:predicted MPP superfamily phosphohydrolase
MKMRFALILTAILSLFVYVGWRLAESFGTLPSVAAMVILFVGLLFFRPIHRIKNRRLRTFLIGAIHLEMGFLSFLLTFIIARDLIFIPLGFKFPEISVQAYSAGGTAVLIALAVLSLFVGSFIASAGPWVVRVSVPVKGLPPELEGFSIAQLSDMHIGPTTRADRIERIVRKTLDLQPRMIALTGDIGDGPVSESREAIATLGKLTQVPSFYVTGNHEYYWDGPEWIAAFSSVGLKPLLNKFTTIREGAATVAVIGTPDPTARMLGTNEGPDVKKAISRPLDGVGESVPANAIKILLAHQPGISNEARDAGIHLQLSGHTHAGQFFPWTLVVKQVHEFSQGLGRTGSLWVYVNPGTGSWGPQIRLGTKTEITLLTLTKES